MLPAFEYAEARSIDDALTAAATAPSMFLAGGQGLLSEMARGIRRPVRLVDVSRIPELATTNEEGGATVTGSLVRLRDVASEDVPPALSLLAVAAARVGSPPIRTRATIGGNLCHGLGTSEVALAALASGAEVIVADVGGSRRVLRSDELAAMRPADDRSPYLVLAVRWPAPPSDARVGVDVVELGEQHDWLPAVALASVVHSVDGAPALARTAVGFRSGERALVTLDEPTGDVEAAVRASVNGSGGFPAGWVAAQVADSLARAVAQTGGRP